jgi:hypothetical protein
MRRRFPAPWSIRRRSPATADGFRPARRPAFLRIANDGNDRMLTHCDHSSHDRSRVRRWLLLYWPSRNRAWISRLLFYFLTFFVIPSLSLAGLGAYLGPEHSLAGIPAVLFFLFLAVFVRRSALRADATLGKLEGLQTGHRLSEAWPFPLEAPPPRHPVQGYFLSFVGLGLIWMGFLCAGLAANGVVWATLLLFGVRQLPLAVTIILCILAIVIGAPTSILTISTGTQLRDRGRRLRARDARTLLQRPGERTVLLLRSFDDEELVDSRPMSLFQQRYEESLSVALSQLGPVITVGRPGDPMGFAGAARFYVSHQNWQSAVQYLMVHSAAVVVIVGRTEGLWWEIETALKCVAREHLLFFFPPVDTRPRNSSRIDNFIVFLRRWNMIGRKQMENERPARYQLF